MMPEAGLYLEKPKQLLATARNLAADGYNNHAARDAYLAGLNAAQAMIVFKTGKIAKTHNGVNAKFAELSLTEPRITHEARIFLSQNYQLKAIADYEVGDDAIIPMPRAIMAIESATIFIECIERILEIKGL